MHSEISKIILDPTAWGDKPLEYNHIATKKAYGMRFGSNCSVVKIKTFKQMQLYLNRISDHVNNGVVFKHKIRDEL